MSGAKVSRSIQRKTTATSRQRRSSNSKATRNPISSMLHSGGIMKRILIRRERSMSVRRPNSAPSKSKASEMATVKIFTPSAICRGARKLSRWRSRRVECLCSPKKAKYSSTESRSISPKEKTWICLVVRPQDKLGVSSW